MALWSVLSVLCVTLTWVAAHATRTAVVLESPALQQTHSKFFKLLEGALLLLGSKARAREAQCLESLYDSLLTCSPRP